MGAGLVGRAIAYAVDVPLQPNEFRLLVGMSLTALDGDAQPRYFDCREAYALILGRRVPDDNGDEEVRREREAAFKAVKVALQGLVKVGAIHRAKTGGNGRRAEYNIMLDTVASLSTTEVRRRKVGGRSASLAGVRSASQLGDVRLPVAVRPAYPSGIQEPQEPREELQGTNASTSLEPVDNSDRKAA